MDAAQALAIEKLLPAKTVAVRLADEGIPVRAIARSTAVPSDEIYDFLREALAAGQLIELPRDDWPPGSTRAQRLEAAAGVPTDDRLLMGCMRAFKVSPQMAALLAAIIKRTEVTSEQLHQIIESNRPDTEGKAETGLQMVSVLICKLRKQLKAHEIVIETIWGQGYTMNKDNRDKAFRIIRETMDG